MSIYDYLKEEDIDVGDFESAEDFLESEYDKKYFYRMSYAFLMDLVIEVEVNLRNNDEDLFAPSGVTFLWQNTKIGIYMGDKGFILFFPKLMRNYLRDKFENKITRVYNKVKNEHYSRIKKQLELKKLAIRNQYRDYAYDLFAIEVKIEEEIENELEYYDSPIDYMMERTSLDPQARTRRRINIDTFITAYIHQAFSLIEHISICLLPLWETKNTIEWRILKEEASDSFIPDTWTTFLLNKDNCLKDYMYFVEKVMYRTNPELAKEYRTAKNDLRNVLSHGYITSTRLDNLSYNIPSFTKKPYLYGEIESTYNEITEYSFYRVRHLYDSFLEWVKKSNEIFYLLIVGGINIPADPKDLLDNLRGDPKKTEEFIAEWKEKEEQEYDRIMIC